MGTAYKSPTDNLRLEFLKELQKDLNRIGNKVSIKVPDDFIEFNFTPRSFPTDEVKLRAEMIVLYDKIRIQNLKSEKDFLVEMEQNGVIEQLADGKDIDTSKIKPEIRVCKTQAEKKIYRYYRQFQKIPNSSGVGRRFSALVYDIGQSREILMGVIGLAGTAYSIEDRDRFFGWSNIDSKAKEIKDAGLRRIMELSICMALPPYNDLRCAKLIASLSLSDPIQAEFQRRYINDTLLAVVTTGATGDHAPMFNRIRLNQITPNDIYNDYNNEMYKHIGATSENTTIMLTDNTIELARQISKEAFPNLSSKQTGGFHSGFNKGNAVYRILRLCNISRDILKLIKKSLYVGYLSESNLNLLRVGKQKHAVTALDVDHVTEYWKTIWLKKAIEDEEGMKRFIQFKRKHGALSQLL